MSKKKADGKSILVYLAILLLILVIALPPLLRVLVPKEQETTIEEAPKITALLCKKQLTVGSLLYQISTNSTYEKGILQKVTFTYRSSLQNDSTTPQEQTPSEQDTNQTPNNPGTEPLPTNPVEPAVTDDFVQQEMEALSAIPGMEIETGEEETKLVLTKEVADAFEEDSPYRSYFQKKKEQQAYFSSQGYSCQTLTN